MLVQAATQITCAEARSYALSVSANNELYNGGEMYMVQGYVTYIQTAWNSGYKNVSFWMADTQNGGNVIEAYKCVAETQADAPNVGALVRVTGQLTKHGTTPEFAQGCTCEIISNGVPPINLGPKTIAEFISLANTKDTCILTGVVTNIASTKYGNFYIADNTGTAYVYGLSNFTSYGIEEGDTVTVAGVYALYGTNHEVVGARYISHKKPTEAWVPVPKTISEFIALNDGKRYILRGVVSLITDQTYGHFTLTDETADIIVWGIDKDEDGNAFAFNASDISEGDTLSITGIYQLYNSTNEVTSAHYINHVHPASSGQAATLRICAQNLENYYYNYTQSTRPSYSDAEGFRTKTVKIVNAMLTIDADIYAFCEVEAKPIVLQQLADSMNAHAGVSGRYAAVNDGIDYTWYDGITDNQIKSGFIYRTDKVATVGSNSGAVYGSGYYARTMRIQAFKQLSNNEKFVVSMNHFKAKDSSSDQGEAQRQTNANNLVSAVGNLTADPDILILGDLNCEYGEAPITTIVNAGFEEQLLKYDAYAWSHCYGGGELIDHVLANPSMAAQIVNAYVKHVSAYKCNSAVTWDMSWSDHDPYVVELNLGRPATPEGVCVDIDETHLTDGMGDMTTEGESVWSWYSNGYAKGSKQGGYTGYLMTPAMSMKGMKSAEISFQHAHKFAGTPAEELTLWVTPDYQGDVAASEWHQLTISPYTDNNSWTWADVSIDVPVAYLGANTVFAFKYMSTDTKYATWEIKNLHITAECAGSTTDIDQTSFPSGEGRGEASKLILLNGQIFILRGEKVYTVTGQEVR